MTSIASGMPLGNTRPTAADTGQLEGTGKGVARKAGSLANTASLPPGKAKPMPVALPPASGEMRGLVKDMAAQPPVDAGRVSRLALQISGGAYKLDVARIADAMIASTRSG